MVVYYSDEIQDRPRATRGVIRLLRTVAQRPAPDNFLPTDLPATQPGMESKTLIMWETASATARTQCAGV